MKNNKSGQLAIPEARAEAPASFVLPMPLPENGIKKWGTFTLGIMVGAVAVTMAQTILEEIPQYGQDSEKNLLPTK